MGCSASSLDRNAPPLHRKVHITLTREDGRTLGLRVGSDRFGIVARGVMEGSFLETWNTEHPALDVRHGDRILSVNGIAVDSSWNGWWVTVSELRKSTVHLVVERSAWRPGALYQGGPWPPQHAACWDRVLPEGFVDDLPRVCPDDCCASECPICLEQLQANSDIVQLPCRHGFHLECIEQWLMRCPARQFPRCPTCRAQVPAATGARARGCGGGRAAEGRRAAGVAEGRPADAAEGSGPDGRDAEAAESRATEVARVCGTEVTRGAAVAEGRDTEAMEGSRAEDSPLKTSL